MPDALASASLMDCVALRIVPETAAVFAAELERLEKDPTLERLLGLFPAVSRRLGSGPLTEDENAFMEGPEDRVPLSPLNVDTAGRIALLQCIATARPAFLEAAVWAVYREGDTLEKIAVVRALPLLPQAERFLELSLDAGRTNDTRLFAAVACRTPFPMRHYPELEFNKLYMKAAFVKVPLDQIIGLAERANSELARMASDYVAEQEAAGRAFPPEIWRAIAFYPPAGAIAKMREYAVHESPAARLGAVLGLAQIGTESTIRSFLLERLGVESDPAVRAALGRALEPPATRDDRSLPR